MEAHDAKTWSLPFGEHAEIDFDADMAHVLVMPIEAGEAPRLELGASGDPRVRVEVRREGETVRVEVQCLTTAAAPLAWLGLGSRVRLALYVPTELRGRVHTNAGKVQARGLSARGLELSTEAGAISAEDCRGQLRLSSSAGQLRARRLRECDLDARTDAGAIELEQIAGRVRAQTSAGKIDIEDFYGAIDAETNAGSIRLRILGLDAGTHRVRTNMGPVSVDLARGLSVAIETRTGLGSSRVDYPVTAGAPSVLSLATDMGAIRVREGSAVNGFDAPGNAGPYRAGPTPGSFATSTSTASASASHSATGASESAAHVTGTRVDPAELHRVLEMVEQGKISARDAGELLRAMGHG